MVGAEMESRVQWRHCRTVNSWWTQILLLLWPYYDECREVLEIRICSRRIDWWRNWLYD